MHGRQTEVMYRVRRMYWVLLLASVALALNIVATIGGLTIAFYEDASRHSPGTDAQQHVLIQPQIVVDWSEPGAGQLQTIQEDSR